MTFKFTVPDSLTILTQAFKVKRLRKFFPGLYSKQRGTIQPRSGCNASRYSGMNCSDWSTSRRYVRHKLTGPEVEWSSEQAPSDIPATQLQKLSVFDWIQGLYILSIMIKVAGYFKRLYQLQGWCWRDAGGNGRSLLCLWHGHDAK